tara:strand:+ start:61466 stop:62665 length:1200 start_codon:yes stop_codon:yes gene_type:complete
MKRREFLRSVSAVAASAAVVKRSTATDDLAEPLSDHRIKSVTTRWVDTSWPRPVGRNAVKDKHGQYSKKPIVVLTTDQGVRGWGQVRGTKQAIDAVKDRVTGKTVSELFSPSDSIAAPHLTSLELALHDLAGKILEMPVWKMIATDGRDQPFVTRIYSGMIYFDDLDPAGAPAGIDKLIEECQWDYDYGYRQFKLKIGRGHRWMKPAAKGLQRDIDAVQAIHQRFPNCDILVDANNGYSVDDCIEFLSGVKGVPLFWVEEPFHESVDEYRRLNTWMDANGFGSTYLADGEAKPDAAVLDQLQSDGVLDVRLEDVMSVGFTGWRTMLPRLISENTLASPHAWGCGLKTFYIAHLAAAFGGVPTIEGVTMSDADIDFGENKIQDGNLQVSSEPGFGLKLKN